ncbi:MAG TPA: hypothetical protein VJB57_18335 [Dehalococcoidia bacterium]|nr:hypothetical protein [Dehalococcoidia bacterium]
MMRSSLRRATGLPRLLLLALLLPPLTACGVSFSETFDGTEMFKTISLAGERAPNAQLTVTVAFTQTYPVPVELACFYESGDKLSDDDYRVAFQERAKRIGEVVLPPYTPPLKREVVSFDFSVPEPGNYFLACLTPAAADNGLGLLFTIHEGTSIGARP